MLKSHKDIFAEFSSHYFSSSVENIYVKLRPLYRKNVSHECASTYRLVFMRRIFFLFSHYIAEIYLTKAELSTAQERKISIKDFYSKFDQIRSFCGFGHIY